MALASLIGSALCVFAKLLTGVRAVWLGSVPNSCQRVYFANHRSHVDFLLVWASLPARMRRRTRPVASADYWQASALRRYLINQVFHGALIDRNPTRHQASPIELMGEALAAGDSLIIFPEGTRNLGDMLLPFKSGIYHMVKLHPEVELVPVWIENLGRVMPKGTLVPVPLLCSLTFGPVVRFAPDDTRDDFLRRTQEALLALAPPVD